MSRRTWKRGLTLMLVCLTVIPFSIISDLGWVWSDRLSWWCERKFQDLGRWVER